MMLNLVAILLMLATFAVNADEISEKFPDFERIENILTSSDAETDTFSDTARRKRAGGKDQTSTEKPQYGPESEKEKEERFIWFGNEMEGNARRILAMHGEAEASRRMRQAESIFNPIRGDSRAILPQHGPLDRITTHHLSSLTPDETIMFGSADNLKTTPESHSAMYDPSTYDSFPLRKKRSTKHVETVAQKREPDPPVSKSTPAPGAVRRRKRSLLDESGIVDHSTYNPPHYHRLRNVVRADRGILPHVDVTHQQSTHPLYPHGLFNPDDEEFSKQRDLFLKQDDGFRRSYPSFLSRPLPVAV